MTKVNMELVSVENLIVTFDICSSTSILEDLILSNNIVAYRDLIIKLKEHIIREAEVRNFEVYKFLGDGWILIFPLNSIDKDFMNFISSIFLLYQKLKRLYLIPILGNIPPNMGLTMGIDKGIVSRIIMNNQVEYFGRPINVACRLQGATGQNNQNPSNKVLLSRPAYTFLRDIIGIDFTPFNPVSARRSLRNIQGGTDFRCMKLVII